MHDNNGGNALLARQRNSNEFYNRCNIGPIHIIIYLHKFILSLDETNLN